MNLPEPVIDPYQIQILQQLHILKYITHLTQDLFFQDSTTEMRIWPSHGKAELFRPSKRGRLRTAQTFPAWEAVRLDT